jgi:hypothetical protein
MTTRRLAMLALAALATLAFPGCVQMRSETIIDQSGGGTASITISMSQAVSDALEQMQEMDTEGGPGGDMPAFDDLDRATIEKRVTEFGVKLTRFEKGERDGRETLDIAYEFKDPKGLSAAMGAFLSGSESEENGLGIFDAGDGNLVLRPASYDFPDWDAEDTTTDEATDPTNVDPQQMQKQMALMGTLMSAIAELDVSMKITVPGDIVSTNAPAQEGRTSIWAVNASNMMSMDQNVEPEIVFSGKGLRITPQVE